MRVLTDHSSSSGSSYGRLCSELAGFLPFSVSMGTLGHYGGWVMNGRMEEINVLVLLGITENVDVGHSM